MRAHGIMDFPDPNSNGGVLLRAHQGSDLDPNNPQLQAASQACKSLAPKAPTGGPGQARAAAAMLKYARCMRAHGITDFPDPGSNGQLSIKAQPRSDLNPNGPQFQSANKACHGELPGGGLQTTRSGGGSK
jgi:predicted carbohydrate-binding protein with CBM5 and CBM33 domain